MMTEMKMKNVILGVFSFLVISASSFAGEFHSCEGSGDGFGSNEKYDVKLQLEDETFSVEFSQATTGELTVASYRVLETSMRDSYRPCDRVYRAEMISGELPYGSSSDTRFMTVWLPESSYCYSNTDVLPGSMSFGDTQYGNSKVFYTLGCSKK
jgi:hypothetical protein